MSIDLLKAEGVPLDRQRFTWQELAGPTYSKLDVDAFTRVRVVLLGAIEAESQRFQHAFARRNGDLRLHLSRVRRVEHHQQTLVNWLHPPDQTPLDTTLCVEQAAIEVTAAVAQQEPDPVLARVQRFGLLEEFDHLYRFSALMDRLCGQDANALLQSYTDVLPGRPTVAQHRAPEDDLRRPYVRKTASPLSKLHALTILAGEHQARDYYLAIGPTFADPLTRRLFAEIASIEEQHVTQAESIVDPSETWLEQWLLHEANEVYVYWSCVESETHPRLRRLWERLLEYELGHLAFVRDLFQNTERRDAAELLPASLPAPIDFSSQRRFVREVLSNEVGFTAIGQDVVDGPTEGSAASRAYREQLNSGGSPSQDVAASYMWNPGTELALEGVDASMGVH